MAPFQEAPEGVAADPEGLCCFAVAMPPDVGPQIGPDGFDELTVNQHLS